jgi:VCBS repeat-containing protein
VTARHRLLVGAALAGLWLAFANVGGANEPPAELNVVCVDSQGNVYQAASGGDCGRRTTVYRLPQDRPFLMCSDNRSGALRWVAKSNGCTSRESLLTVPDSGPIYVCSRNKQAGAVLPTGLLRHVSDPGQCDPKAETPYVTPAAPVPAADTFHASEDELLEVPPRGVLANDFDLTGQPLTAHAVTPPSPLGSFLLRTDGSFRYDPRTLFDHLDDGAVAYVPFDYAADDGALRSAPARATIVVRGRNDVPVALPDAYDVPEDSVLTVPAGAGVLANDTDAETHPLSAVLVSGPAQGALTLNSDGSLRYDPGATFQSLAGGQSSAVTFTYLTRDGTSESSTATVTVTVKGVNDAPVVRSDQYTTDENTVLTVAAPGVLANDTDAENQALAAHLVSGPTAGTLSAPLAGDGSFAFDPRVAFDGLDTGQSATATFVYRAVDAQGGEAEGQVTVTVVGVGLPVAVNDEVTTDEDTAVAVDVLANDARRGGAITAVGPALGSVQGPDSRQLLTYDPRARDKAAADQDPFDHLQAGTTGTDGFTYTVTNAEGSVQGNVVVRVAGRNDAPVAVADAGYSVPSGQRLTVPAPGVLGNDTDAEGDPLSAVLVSPPARGRLTLDPDGSFVYEPADDLPAGQAATVTFSYRASDGRAESGTATASVQIQGVNHPPAVPAQELTVREDRGAGHVIGQVAFSDPDPGQSHSFAIVAGDPTDLFDVDAAGTLLLNRPDLDFETTPAYALTLTVTDEAGASGSGALTVRVVDVNEQGASADDAYAAIGNTQLAAGGAAPTGTVAARTAAAKVLDNDSDPDGSGSLSVVVPAPNGPQPTSQGGSYVMQPDGRFVYDPPAGFVGTDTFTYTATDGTNTTPAATVRITVRNRVWYVDNRLAGAGTGTSRSPFSSLAPVAGASGGPDGPCTGTGPTLSCDWVHLASTTTPYQGPLVLEDGERLVGQGADLVVDGTLLIARAPTAPTIAFSTAAGGVELATGNDVRGVDVAGAGGPALHGDGFGTLTMAAGRLSSAGGPALSLANGSLAGAGAPAATAAVLDSTGSLTDGVHLDRVAGALSVPGATTVASPAAAGVRILANTAQVTLSSVAVSDATGAGLEVVDNRGAVAVNGGTIARTAGTGLEVRGGADNGSLVVRAGGERGQRPRRPRAVRGVLAGLRRRRGAGGRPGLEHHGRRRRGGQPGRLDRRVQRRPRPLHRGAARVCGHRQLVARGQRQRQRAAHDHRDPPRRPRRGPHARRSHLPEHLRLGRPVRRLARAHRDGRRAPAHRHGDARQRRRRRQPHRGRRPDRERRQVDHRPAPRQRQRRPRRGRARRRRRRPRAALRRRRRR